LTTKEWLENQRTKCLLQLKKDYKTILHSQGCVWHCTEGMLIYFDLDDINKVLNTREHIPTSKADRKVIRQEAAKRKSRWYVTPF
jgi:Fe-S-cluster-containing dehydrogenase component